MEIITKLHEYCGMAPLALSIGMFDGVHIGHQQIIGDLIASSEQKNLMPAALTFWPHPRLAINPNENLKLLTTLDEKCDLLNAFGLQKLFVQDFSEEFRNMAGEEFVQQFLIKKLNVKYLLVGYDHSFGKNKSGNFKLLQKLAPQLGFEVKQTGAVRIGGENISSTKIRNLLLEGKITQANKMLGYAYSLGGTVIHGKKLGRTIGYPTANLLTKSEKLLPKKGAYVTSIIIDGKFYKSMTSIGTNPTVNGESLTVESYILDFSENIYGKKVVLNFHEFLHDEIKFESIDKLTEKLNQDRIITENFNY